MEYPYRLKFRACVRLTPLHADIVIAHEHGKILRVHQPSDWKRIVLGHLKRDEGITVREMISIICGSEPENAIAHALYFVGELERRALLTYTVTTGEEDVAVLEPLSSPFLFRTIVQSECVLFSRFAYIHRVRNEFRVESPLGGARITLKHHYATAIIGFFADPLAPLNLRHTISGLGRTETFAFISLLLNAKVVHPCDLNGRILREETPPLQYWAFHDLLFHVRTRRGRHDAPIGATFPFTDDVPLPADPHFSARRSIRLHEPDHPNESLPVCFTQVLKNRRSRREASRQPIVIGQLSEFLFRVAGVQRVLPANAETNPGYEHSMRPCPSAGAIHPIELYLTVGRCKGLRPGLYRYNGYAHSLDEIGPLGPSQKKLLMSACSAACLDTPPDVLITLAARYQRIAWKYESIAYATILKEVGILMQQMYLVATALHLAPCALGTGNSDLFADASGLDYYTDSAVGEFILSRPRPRDRGVSF
jgi:oxazoline/thiazoline dehydrogenase